MLILPHTTNLRLHETCRWWREVDSNHRRRKPADLQSAPVGRLGIPPTKNAYCVDRAPNCQHPQTSILPAKAIFYRRIQSCESGWRQTSCCMPFDASSRRFACSCNRRSLSSRGSQARHRRGLAVRAIQRHADHDTADCLALLVLAKVAGQHVHRKMPARSASVDQAGPYRDQVTDQNRRHDLDATDRGGHAIRTAPGHRTGVTHLIDPLY
jgi:hypothetical protein